VVLRAQKRRRLSLFALTAAGKSRFMPAMVSADAKSRRMKREYGVV
jgi:hypothetical protein